MTDKEGHPDAEKGLPVDPHRPLQGQHRDHSCLTGDHLLVEAAHPLTVLRLLNHRHRKVPSLTRKLRPGEGAGLGLTKESEDLSG